MTPITPDDLPPAFKDALFNGREESYLEYKGDVPWSDRNKQLEMLQTVFAMCNEEGGGTIVVGVSNDGTRVGLSDAHFATYSHDTINQILENKCNQSISCKVDKVTILEPEAKSPTSFVFIQASETKEFPLVYTAGLVKFDESKESFLSNIALRSGALYIRTKTSVGNKEIETTQEWQGLVEQTLRKYRQETIRRQSIRTDISEGNPFDKELSI